jgi:Peptidase family M1 domain
MKHLIIVLLIIFCSFVQAQPERWQQRVEYKIDVSLDNTKHLLKGTESIKYFNNSNDLLDKAFFHLYFNAFQPGSAMDIKSLNIADPDPRVRNRISKLIPDSMGFQKIKSLKMNGIECKFSVEGTILEVILPKGIKPKSVATFDLEFEAQVPEQIRRTGRNNKEGIDYSMAQWYPKICEYDYQGWHANPYVAREFYGVWGDFEVNINIDSKYTIGATGYLQNPDDIGKGYSEKSPSPKNGRLLWKFKAYNVHDFVWAADPDYKHITRTSPDGIMIHLLYQPTGENDKNWNFLADLFAKTIPFINKTFGQYPYKSFSVIQGGDGGMEYPMATLVTGNRPQNSLIGVTIHEALHNWYYGVLGSNEALYPWMDEGFTTYAETIIENYIREQGWIPGEKSNVNPLEENLESQVGFSKSGREEILSSHADHYISNTAYSVASYIKGCMFIHQLSYIIGKKNFDKGLLSYFDIWKFKHPNPNDVIRVFEKTSGLELDWYKEYMMNSLHQIDYAVDSVYSTNSKSQIIIKKVGKFIMPLDILVHFKNGTKEWFYIPLDLMRGEKPAEDDTKRTILKDWQWTNPTYEFNIPSNKDDIISIEIDPLRRITDVNKENNLWRN